MTTIFQELNTNTRRATAAHLRRDAAAAAKTQGESASGTPATAPPAAPPAPRAGPPAPPAAPLTPAKSAASSAAAETHRAMQGASPAQASPRPLKVRRIPDQPRAHFAPRSPNALHATLAPSATVAQQPVAPHATHDPANPHSAIPLSRRELRRRLSASLELPLAERRAIPETCDLIEALEHHRTWSELDELRDAYGLLDPDHGAATRPSHDMPEFLDLLETTLSEGNWAPVTQGELDDALSHSSTFPISFDIDFDEYVDWRLYKLGESVRLESREGLFGRLIQRVRGPRRVPVYDRIVHLVEFQHPDWFADRGRQHPGDGSHGTLLRMYRNVPQADLEILFPNARPHMRLMDRMQVLIPLVFGLTTLGLRFAPQLLGWLGWTGSPAPEVTWSWPILGGFVAVMLVYATRSYIAYLHTRDRYLASVSRSLYFRGLANNSQVITAVIELAEEQEVKEVVAAWLFLLGQRGFGHDERTLDLALEQWFARIGLAVDFDVPDAIRKLRGLGLVVDGPDGELQAVWPRLARRTLATRWDDLFPTYREEHEGGLPRVTDVLAGQATTAEEMPAELARFFDAEFATLVPAEHGVGGRGHGARGRSALVPHGPPRIPSLKGTIQTLARAIPGLPSTRREPEHEAEGGDGQEGGQQQPAVPQPALTPQLARLRAELSQEIAKAARALRLEVEPAGLEQEPPTLGELAVRAVEPHDDEALSLGPALPVLIPVDEVPTASEGVGESGPATGGAPAPKRRGLRRLLSPRPTLRV